jgi:hypothetical protein
MSFHNTIATKNSWIFLRRGSKFFSSKIVYCGVNEKLSPVIGTVFKDMTIEATFLTLQLPNIRCTDGTVMTGSFAFSTNNVWAIISTMSFF